MREDEEQARAIRQRHRHLFDSLTPAYGGKILQYYGDGTLSIFNSSVAAVECAVKMQRAFAKDPRVPLRIGIHTGDVIHDETELFGDGVNVASRIEPCCVTGGVYITGRVFDDIRNHDWLSARKLGAYTFKGLNNPVDIFAVDNEGIAVPTEEDLLNLDDPPSKLIQISKESHGPVPERIRQIALLSIPVLLLGLILLNVFHPLRGNTDAVTLPASQQDAFAVLPFENFSAEAENEYFSDGITEEILTLISRIEGLKVVSRTSTMQYKDSEKDIRQIGRELGARHILEGSVRREGNQVRITVQLIDALDDLHIWSETYDREITEIFEVQSQVAAAIAASLQKQLSPQEKAMITKKPTQSVIAYDYYLQGREYYATYTPENNERAIALFHKAISRDSGFALAYAGLGDALAQKAMQETDTEGVLDSAVSYSLIAIRLDPELSEGYKALGLAYHTRGWYDRALEQYFRAIDRNANNEMALNNIAMIYRELGQHAEAIRWGQKAWNLNPRHTWTLLNLAGMYTSIGADEQAQALLRQGLEHHPDFVPFRQALAYDLMSVRKNDAATEQALALISAHPESSAGYLLMGELALREGAYDDARAFLDKGRSKPDGEISEALPRALYDAYLARKAGREDEAKKLLDSLIPQSLAKARSSFTGEHFVTAAMALSLSDETDKAMEWLWKAVEHHWLDYRLARDHPFFENLRGHKEYKRLLRLMEHRQAEIRREVLRGNTSDRLT